MQTMLLPAGQVVRHARDFFDLAAVVTVQRKVNKRQRPGDLMVNSSNECSDGIFTKSRKYVELCAGHQNVHR